MAGKEHKKAELPEEKLAEVPEKKEKPDLEKKLLEDHALIKKGEKKIEEFMKIFQFETFSSKYLMRNGRSVYIPTGVYSFSSELISDVNYVICKIIEGDDNIPSDMSRRKRHSIIHKEYHEKEEWEEILDNYSLHKPEGKDALFVKIKNAQDSLFTVENALRDLIVHEKLFSLEEKYPEFDPLNNLDLYGNSAIIASLYLKRIANPAYRSIFEKSNNCASVFKDYFMIDMALKMCENIRTTDFSIPDGYLPGLKYTILKLGREHEKSFYDLIALESVVNSEIISDDIQ